MIKNSIKPDLARQDKYTINTKLVKYLAKCLGMLSHYARKYLAKCSMYTINTKLVKYLLCTQNHNEIKDFYGSSVAKCLGMLSHISS